MYDFTHTIKIFVVTLKLLAVALALAMSVASMVEGHELLGGLSLSLLVALIIAKMIAAGGRK